MRNVSLCFACIGVLAAETAAIAQYVPIRQLDTNGVFASDYPLRMRTGVAVGVGYIVPARHALPIITAALWDASGSTVLPPLPGLDRGEARDLQVGGDVVGESMNYWMGQVTATLWHNGSPIDLNSLVTGGASLDLYTAFAIDRRGRIAGAGERPDGTSAGYLFDSGVLTDLGALPGGTGAWPETMNDHLQIVGNADSANVNHAFLWDNGTLIDLHDPTQITGPSSVAIRINRFGAICGFAEFNNSTTQRNEAVVWILGVVTDLGVSLLGPSYAYGLNDFGEIVGVHEDPVLGYRACIFENGGATDLNTLIDPASGWTLDAAYDVDDEGRIVGTGFFQGSSHGYILEPNCKGTFTVYGTGCPGTGGVVPDLYGAGGPTPDRDFALAVSDGVPFAVAFLFVGAGNGTVTLKPGCDLQVLPLLLPPFVSTLDGFGEQWLAAHLPSGTPTFDLYLQEFFFDAGAAFGISATQPLQMHFE